MDTLLKRMQEQAASYANSGMRFVDEITCNKIPSLSKEEIDSFDFGVVKLDDNGVVLLYNKTESIKANVPQKEAIGKNFFTQIAPCTNNAIFYGSFKKGIDEKVMNYIFPYTFTYKMKPTPVKVHLFRHDATRTNWVFVKF